MTPWPFVILLVLGLAIHLVLGLYSRKFKSQPVQLPFEILMYICVIWCATYIFDISSDSLQFKIYLMQLRFIAISFISLSLFMIAVFFTGHNSWITKNRLAMLLVIPVSTVILALTTQYSNLFRYNYTLIETSGGFSVLGFTNGIWSSLVYLPFNYLLEIVTLILLIQVITSNQKLYAKQALFFFVAVLIPVIFDILFMLGLSPVRGYNLVPSTFALTGILLAIALFEYRFIDIVPVARTLLFEYMSDPIIVLNPEGKIVDINPAAEKILELNHSKDIGNSVDIVLKKFGPLLSSIEKKNCSQNIILNYESTERIFEVSIQEIVLGGGAFPGKIVYLRDVTERTRAEERVIHLASFPELTPLLILETDFSGSIRYINPSCTSTLKDRGEEDPRIFIPLDILDFLGKNSAIEGFHEVRDIEIHGRIFSMSVYLTPKFSSLRIYATDITDRKRMEDELKNSEEKFSTAFKTSPYAMAITKISNGKFIEVNDAFTQITGFSKEQAQDSSSVNLHLWVDPVDRSEMIEALTEGRNVKDKEFLFRMKNGEILTGLLSAQIIYINKEPCILSSISNITERKLALQKLNESNERFKIVSRAINDIVWDWDLKADSMWWSEAVYTVLGYRQDEIGKSAQSKFNLIHPEEKNKVISGIYSVIESVGDKWSEEFRFCKPDSSYADIYDRGYVIRDNSGKAVRMVGAMLDMTEQKRVADERERLLLDLEQKNADLERFLYSVSHDLKTPLISISGFLGYIERDVLRGDQVHFSSDLIRIKKAASTMTNLLESVLEYSKVGKIVANPENVSVVEVAKEASDLLAVAIIERKVSLTIAENLPEVYGEKNQLIEIMVNLIENGIKFMGDQSAPKIEIGVSYEANDPVLFVRDNGMGIPYEYQDRLFILFERIEPNIPGTGVGLALVKRIIEYHGGKIWVESKGKGKGTIFWFTLPGLPKNHEDYYPEHL